MQRRIPAVWMRGGTSKALFFHARELPTEREILDPLLLKIFGSPDGKQIDGLGGAAAVTSKCALIGPPSVADADVDYTFLQIGVERALVDRKANCGNIAAAVGPFAIDEGLVAARSPTTRVRIFNTNTRKRIEAEVPVEAGVAATDGDCAIAGVPGTGARIRLSFLDPGGALTGRLLPTGSALDRLEVPGVGPLEVSIVDASNAFVFARARDLGLRGDESPDAIDADACLLSRIEAVRRAAGVAAGLIQHFELGTAASPASPKIVLASERCDGALGVRMMALQRCHRSFAVTAAIGTAVAAILEGTLVHELRGTTTGGTRVRIAHPAGEIAVDVERAEGREGPRIVKATLDRTARRLMDGFVYAPAALWPMAHAAPERHAA